jgi:DNA-binding transcriptional regulator GbsR (MarR family)
VLLSPTTEKFILHWGEMGTRWGVNRTVAQIHALLYISPKPLPAEEIAATLSVARSNVSTSIRELQGWGIVRVVHVLGDRRDHFQSLTDVWEMFRIILDERKKRELDPTLAVLRECVQDAKKDKKTDPTAIKRLAELLRFIETITTFYAQIRGLPISAMAKFAKMGKKIPALLGLG